jgi:hypothetical protein
MRIIADRGRQPGPVISYLLREDKREKGQENENPIFHTNMFGQTVQELTEELRFSTDQNERVKRTYLHYKISFPPGENPGPETKRGIVDDLLMLREHGENCQFLAVEHFEKIDKHDVHHLHVLTSTIRLDGTWIDDTYEWVKLKDVERQLEEKWGLQYCPPKEKGERVNSSIKELKLQEQGQILTKDTLRASLDEALEDRPSMPLLMLRVKAHGHVMQFHEFENGNGVSFGAEGKHFKGRQLGDRYSFNGLHKYAGVDYESERDDAMLRQLNQMSTQECRVVLAQLEHPELLQLPEPELVRSEEEEIERDIQEHSRVSRSKLKKSKREHQSSESSQADLNKQLQAQQEWHRFLIQHLQERMRRQAAKDREEKEREQQQEDLQELQFFIGLEKAPRKSQELEL